MRCSFGQNAVEIVLKPRRKGVGLASVFGAFFARPIGLTLGRPWLWPAGRSRRGKIMLLQPFRRPTHPVSRRDLLKRRLFNEHHNTH